MVGDCKCFVNGCELGTHCRTFDLFIVDAVKTRLWKLFLRFLFTASTPNSCGIFEYTASIVANRVVLYSFEEII